jgi:lipoyl(octanoyl) transferase
MAIATQTRLQIREVGLIEYRAGLELQRKTHQEILEGHLPSTLLLLEHPSVYTAGRRTAPEERPQNGIPVIDVNRGGKITWHGPGQLVGYPIVKLKEPTKVVDFVRALERALILALQRFGIDAIQICENSGVWIEDSLGRRKIAAIGIRVANGIVTHGFALNVNPDLSSFEEIIPCGIPDVVTTSMSNELHREITIGEVLPVVIQEMEKECERMIS